MTNTEQVLVDMVFEALVSGDQQRIEETHRTLAKNGLRVIWCQSPLRIEEMDLEP